MLDGIHLDYSELRNISPKAARRAILQVLKVAKEKGYNSAEVAQIMESADAQWVIAHPGILSSTDIGFLVKSLMCNQKADVGDFLVSLGNGNYVRYLHLPNPDGLEEITRFTSGRKRYYVITDAGITVLTAHPYKPSEAYKLLASFFAPMVLPNL